MSDEHASMPLGNVVFCKCGHRIPVRASMAGLAITCSGCGARTVVPSLSSLRQSALSPELQQRGSRTRKALQYRLRHLFVLSVVCALVSAIAHYLGVRLVLTGILFGAFWAAGALFVTPRGRKAIHFFWDSIVGYTPRH